MGLARRSQDAGGTILVTERCSSSSSCGGPARCWGPSGPCRAAVRARFVPFSGSGLSDGLRLTLGWSSRVSWVQNQPLCGSQTFPTLRARSEKLLRVEEFVSAGTQQLVCLRSLTSADGLRVVTAGRSPPDRPERSQPRWLRLLNNSYQRCVQPGGDPRADQDTLER